MDSLSKTSSPLRRIVYSPLFICAVAFAVRSLALYLAWRRGFENGPYAFEAGRIAESIASGHGFSSPLALVHTGPSAWLCPIFPYMMAAVFHFWGIFTPESLAVIQILNCAFASLTVFPIYSLGKRSFGTGIALLASWVWVFLPSAIHTPVADIWDTALTTLLFALILWATAALPDQSGFFPWAAYGVLWATGALVNASMLSVFPLFFAWLVWRRRSSPSTAVRLATVALVAFALVLVPWTIRNYRVFGRFIPFRSAFGLVLWLGNNPRSMEFTSFPNHPFTNPQEAADYQRLGEMPYMDLKRQEALAFMKSHPDQSLKFFMHRIGSNWFSISDRPHETWATDPIYLKAYFVFNAALIGFAWLGLALALRSRVPEAAPYLAVLVVYPFLYYLTGTLFRYRFPMEPLLTVLGVYGGVSLLPESLGTEFRNRTAPFFDRPPEGSAPLEQQQYPS